MCSVLMFFRNHDDFNVIMIYLYHFIAEDLNPSIIKVLFWQSIVDKVWIILGYFVDLLCRRSVGEACASSQKVLYPARFSADNSSLLKKKVTVIIESWAHLKNDEEY